MLNLLTRTKKSGGAAPLFTKIRVGKQAVWINLRLTVDICKWNEVAKSNIKSKNYLEKLGHYRKLQDIEFAMTELKSHHRLTKENIEKAVEDVVLAEVRARVKQEKELSKEIEHKKRE